ncbi:MAG: helix-turn-helix domain-containing protein [bacterium]
MDKNDNIDLYIFIGSKIKQKRLQLKLSQEKISEIINVDYRQIQRYENAIRKIPFDKLLKLAEYFNVPIEYFYDDFKQNIQKNDTTVVKCLLNPELEKSIELIKQIYNNGDKTLIDGLEMCLSGYFEKFKKTGEKRKKLKGAL